MGETPRRRLFQIHLSTAIVMMFVAGGLMWVNLVEFRQTSPDSGCAYVWKGWPLTFVSGYRERTDTESFQEEIAEEPTRPAPFYVPETSLHVYPVAVDVIAGLALLVVVGFLCEWPSRRRAARKGDVRRG